MSYAFEVRGINPGNGRVVEFVILADSAADARKRVEEAGLRYAVIEPYSHPGEPPHSSRDAGGSMTRTRSLH